MQPIMVFALLLLATLGWMAIPFVPALMELFRPQDAIPLNAVGQDSGQLTYFATSFTRRMTEEGLMGTSVPPQLSDGTTVRVHNTMTPLTASRTPIADVVVLMDDTPVADGVSVSSEVLARRTFQGGANSTFRAILGQRDVLLGVNTTVVRWVHANGRLEAAAGTQLSGRATADREILLDAGVFFDRLDAPMVRVVGGGTMETAILPVSAYQPFEPDRKFVLGKNYWRVIGDFTIPAGSSLAGSLIVLGHVVVSEGARVEGSIKAHGTMHIKSRAVVVGSVAARERIVIEDGARLSGPIISEHSIVVGASVIGVASKRTTVTAPRVELRSGATVYGAVMAADGGLSID